MRVVAREYPCLTGKRSGRRRGQRDRQLSCPKSCRERAAWPVDPARVDRRFGPRGTTGARPPPFEPNPWMTYVPEVYERAMKHVRTCIAPRVLSATVGPRPARAPALRSALAAGRCLPVGPRLGRRPPAATTRSACRSKSRRPLRRSPACPIPSAACAASPSVVLHIPIKLGPRTVLYDIAFEGNRALVEERPRGSRRARARAPAVAGRARKGAAAPARRLRRRGLRVRRSRRRARAFARSHPRPRALHRSASASRCSVSGIVVRGARRHERRLIRSRIALEVGEPYRRSLVRQTEERSPRSACFRGHGRLRRSVRARAREGRRRSPSCERKPQYLDVRPGFSTGEGFRITFEYGHRNLAGEAIQLTLRSQLGYLPTRVHPRGGRARASTTSSRSASGSSAATPRPSSFRTSASGRCFA